MQLSTQKKQCALITGASSGIGAMYADRLAARGYDLVLVARRSERLQQLSEQLQHKYANQIEIIIADLSQHDQLNIVDRYIREHSNLSMLVNCAGLGALGPSHRIDPMQLEQMLNVNVIALTRLSLAAVDIFKQAQRGTVINIGSVVAAMPVSGADAYSGSKAYVLNFSRALQAELSDHGITIQVVMPGPVRSEFFADVPAPFPDALFMDADVLVDTALTALNQGESICYPNLQDINVWHHYEQARGAMVKAVTQTGQAAARYIV